MTNNWEPPEDNKAPIPFAPPVQDTPPSGPTLGGAHTETLASWGRRLGGYLIDMIIVAVAGNVLAAIVRTFAPSWFALIVVVAVGFLYPLLMIAKVDGQTVGMKAVKIRCVTLATGEVPDLSRSAGRAGAALVLDSAGAVLFLIPTLLDLLWPLWDKRRQTLHDKIAATVVINVAAPATDVINFG